MRALAAALLLLGLAGCGKQDMAEQESSRTWDRSNFFPQEQTMRPPVPGTVARDAPDGPVPQPASITEAMLARGHERFDIFCSPCHGRVGDGTGMIVQRGFPHPPSFHSAALRQARAQHFYDVVANGHGAMYAFSFRVPPADRWAVVAYIRALQLSQDAPATRLTADDRAALDAAANAAAGGAR